MAHEKIAALAVMLTIFTCVGGISWALVSAQQNTQDNTQLPENMPKLMIHEEMRDAVMAYIKANHTDAAQFIESLTWTGGRQETGLLGGETYIYQAQGWKVTITYPVIPNPVYSITAEYQATTTAGSMGIPYSVMWQGTWQNGVTTEVSYIFAQ